VAGDDQNVVAESERLMRRLVVEATMAAYPVIEVDPRLQMSISLLAFCVPASRSWSSYG